MTFEDIQIGQMVKFRMNELNIDSAVLAEKLKKNESFVEKILEKPSLEASLILELSKILKYDFFRLYSQHLLLYCPPANLFSSTDKNCVQMGIGKILPRFKKNVYTPEIIAFVLSKIGSGTMTHKEVMDTYRIPKTTLYKWCRKYGVSYGNDENR